VQVVTDRDTAQVDLYRFAIDEGIRSLQHQDAELNRIRDRAVALVTLTATASAFLVGAALQANTRGWRFYAPLAVGTALFVLLLWNGWKLLRKVRWAAKVWAEVIVEDFASKPPAQGYALLARYYSQAQDENERVLEGLRRTLQWAIVNAGAMIVVWIVLIWLVAR
jgi:hypothetical protein